MFKYNNILVLLSLFLLFFAELMAQSFNLIKNFTTSSPVRSVRYSPDGKMIAFSQNTIGIRIHNSSDFSYINGTNQDFGNAFAMTFSRDSLQIAYHVFVNVSIGTRIVDIQSNNSLNISPLISSGLIFVHEIDFSFDGDRLIICGQNGYEIYSNAAAGIIDASIPSYGSSYSCKYSSRDFYAIVKQSSQI